MIKEIRLLLCELLLRLVLVLAPKNSFHGRGIVRMIHQYTREVKNCLEREGLPYHMHSPPYDTRKKL